MKLLWIFSYIPIVIFYVNAKSRWLKSFAGRSFGIFIVISNDYENDTGLLAHEITHCQQFYASFGLHALRYWLDAKYRLASELAAYRMQLSMADGGKITNAMIYATFIMNRYRIPSYVTYKQVLAKLMEKGD